DGRGEQVLANNSLFQKETLSRTKQAVAGPSTKDRATARGTSGPFALRCGHYDEACRKQVGITSIMAHRRKNYRQMKNIRDRQQKMGSIPKTVMNNVV